MKVLALAASSSRASINNRLATYAAGLIRGAETTVLDLNDYELPLFSVDREKEAGQPALALEFLAKIAAADALLISFAEHNGTYTAAYKNLFDWCSRCNQKLFQDKPMVLLSTSPGARGGAGVLAAAVNSAPFFAGDVKASLSIPRFYDNFDLEKGELRDAGLLAKLKSAVASLEAD